MSYEGALLLAADQTPLAERHLLAPSEPLIHYSYNMNIGAFIDNRILIFRPRTQGDFHRQKMSPILRRGNMADTSKDGLLLSGGIRHVKLRRNSRAEVNNFLLAYVILF